MVAPIKAEPSRVVTRHIVANLYRVYAIWLPGGLVQSLLEQKSVSPEPIYRVAAVTPHSQNTPGIRDRQPLELDANGRRDGVFTIVVLELTVIEQADGEHVCELVGEACADRVGEVVTFSRC